MWCELVMLPNYQNAAAATAGVSAQNVANSSAMAASTPIAAAFATNAAGQNALLTHGMYATTGAGGLPAVTGIPLNKDLRVALPLGLPLSSHSSQTSTNVKVDTSNHFHIFVGDLGPEVEAHHLRKIFSNFGTVTECKIIKDMHTQKPKGYGFVAYAIKEEAEEAILRMNGQQLGSRTIRTNWAVRKPPPAPGKESSNHKPLNYDEVNQASSFTNCTVYVGGFTKGLCEEVLRDAFAEFGQILEVRIFKEKGYAFIRFDSHEGATRAIITMHGKEVASQPCKCSWGKESNEEKESLGTVEPLLTPFTTSALYSNPLGAALGVTQSPLALLQPQLHYANFSALQKATAASVLNNYALAAQQAAAAQVALQAANAAAPHAITPSVSANAGLNTLGLNLPTAYNQNQLNALMTLLTSGQSTGNQSVTMSEHTSGLPY